MARQAERGIITGVRSCRAKQSKREQSELDFDYIGKVTRVSLEPVTELAQRFGLSPELVKFLIVGAMAFVVHYVALYLLLDAPLFGFLPGKDAEMDLALVTFDTRFLIASLVAVEMAILFKFLWSEGWIFHHRRVEGSIWIRLPHFNLSAASSAALTVTVANVLTSEFGITPYVSTAVGVLCGVTLNWLWSARLVWPDRPTTATSD